MLLQIPAYASMSKESHQLYQQACKLELQNKQEEAINLIKKAIDLSDSDAILYTKLAGLYADIGDYKNALGAYKAAIKLRPNDAFIYISIGNILFQNVSKVVIIITKCSNFFCFYFNMHYLCRQIVPNRYIK